MLPLNIFLFQLFMKKIEVVLKFIKHIVWGLVIEGVTALMIGLLIFLFPDLLGMLVGLMLAVSAIYLFILAYKINKLSSFKIEI